MILVKEKVQCLICLHIVAVIKEYNMKRHYEYAVYTGKLRKNKVCQLDSVVLIQKVCLPT